MTATSTKKSQIRVWGRGNKIRPMETRRHFHTILSYSSSVRRATTSIPDDGSIKTLLFRRPSSADVAAVAFAVLPLWPTAADNTAAAAAAVAAPPALVPGLHFFYRHHVRSTAERDRARTAADQPSRSVITAAAVPVWRFVLRQLRHATSRPNVTARQP